MFHKRPLDTIRHQLPIRHVSFKSRKQYRTDTGKIGSKALALCFPARPLGRRRPPDALGRGSPGRPLWPASPIPPRPPRPPGVRRAHPRRRHLSSRREPRPRAASDDRDDGAERRPPHPHLTSETVGFPRANTGHTRRTPELGTSQRPPPNPQRPEVLGAPPPPSREARVGQGTPGESAGRRPGLGRLSAEPPPPRPPAPGARALVSSGPTGRPPSCFPSPDGSPGRHFRQPLCFPPEVAPD